MKKFMGCIGFGEALSQGFQIFLVVCHFLEGSYCNLVLKVLGFSELWSRLLGFRLFRIWGFQVLGLGVLGVYKLEF